MVSNIQSAALVGVDGIAVEVQVQTSRGTPQIDLVGLPELAVRESRVRVRSAIRQSGFEFPNARVVVNLAPADLRKDGSCFDLPIALGVLSCIGTLSSSLTEGWVVVGELSLGGAVRPVRGILAFAEMAKAQGARGLLCASSNVSQALLVSNLDVRGIDSLNQAAEALAASSWRSVTPESRVVSRGSKACWSDVLGQPVAKRAIEVAAAGGHNIVMVGTPGTGKTMLARRLTTILPPMSPTEALTVTKIHSVAGLLTPGSCWTAERPFRSPHHTSSASSMVGGGGYPKPGEVSLAHRGVLFLDELPEFARSVLETLRQPLEDGVVTISRARQVVRFPSRTMLVAALNPCACGWLGSSIRFCECSLHQRQRYRSRLSGPMLDRMDIQISLMPLSPDEFRVAKRGESSIEVRRRVVQARAIQAERFGQEKTNAEVPFRTLRKLSPLHPEVHNTLLNAMRRLGLSPRAHDRLWRVARTIADLDGSEAIEMAHIAESLNYRHFDQARHCQR